MSEELVAYSYEPLNEVVRPKGSNYLVDARSGLPPVVLKRDIDFGVIPNTKKPSLFKPGAEKIATQYGLCQRYALVDQTHSWEGKNVFSWYLVRCDLVKIIEGKEYVISSAFGSANTNERKCGTASAWDTDNARIKMAQKRALVGAVIALCSGSSMFEQDIEDEEFMKKAEAFVKTKDDDPLSKKQIENIFAIAQENGLTIPEARQRMVAMGFASTKALKQKDYDAVRDAMKKKEEK